MARKRNPDPLLITDGKRDGTGGTGPSRTRRVTTAVVGTTASAASGYAAAEVISRMQDLDPELFARLKEYAASNGISLDALLSAGADSGKMLLDLAARYLNMNPTLANEFGLSRKEAAELKRLADANFIEQVEQHDDEQSSIYGDDDLSIAARRKNMVYACNRLGLPGVARFRDLYRIALVFNSITEAHVEDIERHEKLYGKIEI